MIRRKGAGIVLLLLLLAASARAGERVILDNGLTVILDPRPVGDAVQVTAMVRAGRIHEPEGRGGLSHLLEHMMFRSTAARTTGELEKEIWGHGGRLRAYTREDATEYGIQLPASRLPLAVEALADMLRGARLRPTEIAEERRVVLDEIAKRESDPGAFAFEELRGLALAPHPYGDRISGTRTSVGAITPEEVVAYHRATYRPSRTVLVITGGFDGDAALEEVRRRFGSWENVGEEAKAPPSPRPGRGPYQELIVRREGATPALYASVVLPGYLHPDYLPSRFLAQLLDGWLTDVLRGEHDVVLAADSFYTAMKDRNLIRIRLALPEASDAGPARAALRDLFQRLHDTDYDAAGLAETASYFRSASILLGEDLASLARVYAQAYINGYFGEDGVPELLGSEDRYERVTAAAATARSTASPTASGAAG